MAGPYFNQVTSVAALANILRREGKESLGELYRAPNTTMPSASNWDRTHLLACRVLIKNPTNSPAILPLIRDHALPQDQNWPPYIANFLNGPPPAFASTPEHQLVQTCEPSGLGLIWYDLAEFYRSGEFVSSSTIRAGSSSPMDERSVGLGGSSSEPASLFTSGHVHGGASTINFAHLCLSYVLNYGPPQDDPPPGQPLQLDQLRPRHLVAMSNKKRLYHGHIEASNWTAMDDGGLDLQFWDPQLHTLSLGLANPRVCHIEAKSRFRVFVDNEPVPSDLALAQMTGQAIAICQDTGIENIVMLCVTHQHFRFLNFHVPKMALDGLDNPGPIDDLTEDACIVVTCSASLDMSERTHRGFFVRNIAALVNYTLFEANARF